MARAANLGIGFLTLMSNHIRGGADKLRAAAVRELPPRATATFR
jgi:hypothetical protein